MSEIVNRYEKLGFREYQYRAYYYPLVCKELSSILRSAYSQIPKNLQSHLFQDTLAAFRFLPQVHTRSGREAANLLLQAAEFAFPKQKKALAVTEFKHAMVAYKRRHKAQKDVEGSAQLPQDVLVHIFSFLDLRSLAAAGLVCWSWNSAANDNSVWQSQYEIFFGSLNSGSKINGRIGEPAQKSISYSNKKDGRDLITIDWREDFKRTYIGKSSRKFISNRGYCGVCKTVIWLSNMSCPSLHHDIKIANQQLKPVGPQQIVEYLLHGSFTTDSSDTDSDSDDEGSSSKLWAHSRSF